MPATEKTWRDQSWMHVVFGVSALVMLIGTVWMLAKDHNREWRRWQLNDRAREHWTIEAQLAQAEETYGSDLTKLRQELADAKAAPVDKKLVTQFKEQIEQEDARLEKSDSPATKADTSSLDRAYEELSAAEEALRQGEANKAPEEEIAKLKTAAKDARQKLLDTMNGFVREAKRREDAVVTSKKFKAADQTAVVSARGIAVGEGKPTDEIEYRIQELANEIAQLDVQVADAKSYRMALESIVKEVQGKELDLEKQIGTIDAELTRLRGNLGQNPKNALQAPGEWLNRAPVLDALYTGNIKLEQIWLPDMKINYNFSSVARYDRCTVCHRAIDKTAPGSAVEPAYPAIPRDKRERMLQLATPEKPPATADLSDPEKASEALAAVYGIILAPHGQVDKNAVTIQVVKADSPAALAGLQMGDIIQEINGGEVQVPSDVAHYLFSVVPKWGEPVNVNIRRGLDQPYTSHPRLDLFVGGTSPHKKGEMGCTICHDGQGSATDFKFASHTPNDPHQALKWSQTHGWFDNHHWIFPMTPERFIESNCLKCHHEVLELMPSERFPEPPAPKLVKGYELVREYGCYGCHEIPGFDGPTKRIGPDLRLEPNFSEVASQVLTDPGLNDQERSAAQRLVAHPEPVEARNELMQAIRKDAALAKTDGTDKVDAPAAAPRLTPATHALADALKDVDVPGRFRKVGPSLRHLSSKVDYNWLFAWIRRPADFRPTTRMPQFFGHLQHLDGQDAELPIHDVEGKEILVSDQEYTKRFENIEIRALSEFLLRNSQPFTYIDPAQGVTEAPSAERGKKLFQTRGCLACHSHKEFLGIDSTQGPDLSRVSAKFPSELGQRWLYSWVKAPNHYSARTVMPNLFLDPISEIDATGKPTGRVSDPAADIMVYLLSVPADWQPEAPVPPRVLTADEQQALNDLTAVWLSASFPRRRAAAFARNGIPEQLAASVKVDEKILLGQLNDNDRAQRQLEYVARRSLGRYGCFGCHEIPGFETAKPIGTPLASWGRKDPTQLAFENIGRFLETHGIDGTKGHGPAHDSPKALGGTKGHDPAHPTHEAAAHESVAAEDPHVKAESHGIDPLDEQFTPDEGFFLQSILSHQRQGFLWQKLRMPRSFDFETTRTKRYDERLRMPKFPFNDEEREAVMTFILGLTNEAPDSKYIYNPGPREQAIVQGRHVLDKYNCAGCHILDMDRWDIAFLPNEFEEPPTSNDFPFLQPEFTPEQINASKTRDRRGLLHAQLHGMPTRDENTGAVKIVDPDGVAIESDDHESPPFFQFTLYRPTLIDGIPRLVGVQDLMIPASADRRGPARGAAYPGLGGDLAKYLYPHVVAAEKAINPNVEPIQAWGWLPPPLHHEGDKVQTDWLHDFLMDPTEIRPAVVLRMPNFHMSSDEASKLVNYFAAKNNAEFPYEYNARRRGGYLAHAEQVHPTLLDDAMKIVTDGNYCVKCHSLGDFQVSGGGVTTFGPRLDAVYRRLRPEYTRRWVANPKGILPYTGMPVNIPYEPTPPNFGGVNQQLFPGPSFMQLDGVVDLMMNYDEYARRRTSVKSLVREPQAPPDGKPAASDEPPNDRSAQR